MLAWKLPYFPLTLHKITISPQTRGKKGQNTPKLKRVQRCSNDLTNPLSANIVKLKKKKNAFKFGKSIEDCCCCFLGASLLFTPPIHHFLTHIRFKMGILNLIWGLLNAAQITIHEWESAICKNTQNSDSTMYVIWWVYKGTLCYRK